MTEALKPCPFCGGKPLLQSHRIAKDAVVSFVNCQRCGVQTEQFEDAYAPTDQAIEAWNTRQPKALPSSGEVVEALRWIAAFKTGGPYAPGQIKAEHRAMITKARKALSAIVEVDGG